MWLPPWLLLTWLILLMFLLLWLLPWLLLTWLLLLLLMWLPP